MAPHGKKRLQISLRNWLKFGENLLHEMALTLAHGYFCEYSQQGNYKFNQEPQNIQTKHPHVLCF